MTTNSIENQTTSSNQKLPPVTIKLSLSLHNILLLLSSYISKYMLVD